MKTLLLGGFLLAHGLLHASYLTPKPDDPKYPFDFHKGWFADVAGSLAPFVGTTLVVVTGVAFLLAALAVWGVPGIDALGKVFVAVGSISSLLLLILFWHPWLVLGIAIDVVLLYGLYKLGWKFGG